MAKKQKHSTEPSEEKELILAPDSLDENENTDPLENLEILEKSQGEVQEKPEDPPFTEDTDSTQILAETVPLDTASDPEEQKPLQILEKKALSKKKTLIPVDSEKITSEAGRKRRKATSHVAGFVTLIVTASVILLNVLFFTLGNQQSLQLDLTSQKAYKLNISTLQYLNTLDTDVEIIVLQREEELVQDVSTGGYFSQVNAILRGMASANEHIQLSYKELETSPELQTRFSDITLGEGNILVVHNNRKVQINITDLFNIQTQDGVTYTITSSKAEQVMLSSIFTVINEKTTTFTFLTGVGSSNLSAFKNLLTLNGYLTEEKSFLETGWWENTEVLVLCAPQNDLTEEQVSELSSFLEEPEHTLLYFPQRTPATATPRLDTFLAKWGLKIDENVVYETDANNFISNQFITYAQYSEDAFGASLENEDGARVFLPYAHPIDILYSQEGSRYTAPLLTFLTSAHSYLINPTDGETSDSGPRGPFNGAAISSRRFEEGESYQYSQVIAFGSEDVIKETYLNNTLADNGAYFIRLFKSLYPDSAPELIIEEKSLDPAQLDISTGQQQALGMIFMGIVPAVVIMSGILERVRRNRL